MKSQYRLWRKTIPAALAAALALPLAPAPEAEAAALSFADVSRDASWSLGSVVELTQRGIFSGYPDGTFGPNRAVTRLETLVAAVRQMGLRAEAESAEAKRARLSAADAELIRKQYAWATGYVEMAEDHDLLDDEKAELKPGEPADRLFATKVLVRALGLEKEAEAAMGSDLPFRDKAEVNEAAVGYVAVAVEYGLVAGYDDNTFRPGRRVSRAELATLLDRAGDKLPDPKGEFAQASGTVSGVSGREVTLRQTAGATQTFFVGEAATLVRGGRLATPSDLVPGDEATVVLRGQQVIHLTVGQVATVTDGTKQGTIASTLNGTLTIQENGVPRSYKVHPQAAISRNGVIAQWVDLKEGDDVTATVTGGFVTDIVAKPSSLMDGRITAIVKSVGAGQLTLTVDGKDATYKARSDITVMINNAPAGLSQILPGAQATVIIAGGLVFHISATQDVPTISDNEGYVSAVYPTQLLLASNGVTEVFNVSNNAFVYRNGANVALTDIVPGDKVKLLLDNRLVTFITVLEPAPALEETGIVQGTYAGHSYMLGKMDKITLKTTVNGNPIYRDFVVSPDVMLIGGTEAHLNFDLTKIEIILNGEKQVVIIRFVTSA